MPAPTDGHALRHDPLTGSMTVIAPGRARRPHIEADGPGEAPRVSEGRPPCPFCPGNESLLPGLLDERPSMPGNPGPWGVRVVPNRFPVTAPRAPRWGTKGPTGEHPCAPTSPRLRPEAALLPDSGAHEVLIEGPRHGIDWPELGTPALTLSLLAARDRVRHLAAQGCVHVSVFRNHGPLAGASIDHPHMQLVGLDWVPARPRRRARELRRLAAGLGGCPLCARLTSELESSGKRIVLESPAHVAWVPWAPELAGEIWVAPRRHRECFAELPDSETPELAGMLIRLRAAQRGAVGGESWNAVIEWAGPAPPGLPGATHWYVRLLPRLARIAGFELEAGVRVVDESPERAAARIRACLG